jgi:hypothetical protein
MPTITGIEADIVNQILVTAACSYLLAANGGTCRGVADIQTAANLVVTPPAVLVEYAGETASAPHVIGLARQMTRLQWDLFCIAQSYSFSGGGRLDDGQEKGAYTILDDVFNALEGFRLPSQTLYASRLFYSGCARFDLTPAAVIYVSRWYTDVLRQGQ